MGRVYAARDTELDELVALKVLRSGMPDDAIEAVPPRGSS